MDTPKSMGKKIGIVKEIKGNTIILDAIGELANGDGLCYLEQGGLKGIKVNEAVGNRIVCNETVKSSGRGPNCSGITIIALISVWTK